MGTIRQDAANRANSLLSTGPTSDAGTQKSRANALKHGLAGGGLVLPDEDLEVVAERVAQWHSTLRPNHPFDTFTVSQHTNVSKRRKFDANIRELFARNDPPQYAGEIDGMRFFHRRRAAAQL